MSSDNGMWCVCRNCGIRFLSNYATRKRNKASNAKTWKAFACSDKCAAERKVTLEKRRTICAVCGGPKDSRHAITCSAECRKIRKSATAKGKVYNLCVYTAPDTFDYNNMLEILHRKGYVKAKDPKEKWTYSTTGFPNISWFDRLARGVVVSWEASPGKEQQGHENGVQSKAEKVGARANSIQELRSCYQGGTPKAKGAVGE